VLSVKLETNEETRWPSAVLMRVAACPGRHAGKRPSRHDRDLHNDCRASSASKAILGRHDEYREPHSDGRSWRCWRRQHRRRGTDSDAALEDILKVKAIREARVVRMAV
jgi:hypothetical protein